ncbi:MAG: AraC family transcriptional regulator [Kiritimatiellales bacterium]
MVELGIDFYNAAEVDQTLWVPGDKIPLNPGFHLIVDGTYTCTAGRFGTVSLQPGDLLCIFPHEPFHLHDTPFRYMFFSILGPNAVPFLESCGFSPEKPFCFKAPALIGQIMKEIIRAPRTKAVEDPFFFHSRLFKIGELLRSAGTNSLKDGMPDYPRLIQSVVFETDFQIQTLDQIAARLNISEETLRKACVKKLGLSAIDYLTNLRMDRACALLSETSYKISFIASACGYRSDKYFATVFKKTFGVPPSQWRKQQYSDKHLYAR